ncbi:hypothetical protein BaRGS_00007789 [Batillaria attramentaria]|uniref:Uncharacterized protein n=1 Tax=Batillaria attramentaria TaxID=370345 RepID=A0ABD0LN84_9CAEN
MRFKFRPPPTHLQPCLSDRLTFSQFGFGCKPHLRSQRCPTVRKSGLQKCENMCSLRFLSRQWPLFSTTPESNRFFCPPFPSNPFTQYVTSRRPQTLAKRNAKRAAEVLRNWKKILILVLLSLVQSS